MRASWARADWGVQRLTCAALSRSKRLLDEAEAARIRRGMIRYCIVVLDLSNAVNEARAAAACYAVGLRRCVLTTPRRAQSDLRPSRLALLSTLVPSFIRAFFAANPLSQLGLVVARNGICERLTDLSGMPEAHVTALAAALRSGNGGGGGSAASGPVFGGDFSLQNALDLGVLTLGPIPPYGTREVLVLQSALATCDPGNIHKSMADAKAARLRVSVVGLSAEARPAPPPAPPALR